MAALTKFDIAGKHAIVTGGAQGLSEDMKGPVVFLASAASDYLNGALIPVDGGYLVK